MGGKGSGGFRRGAGRPRKSLSDGTLTGSRRAKSREKNQNDSNQNEAPPTASVAVYGVTAPDRLTLAELAEWEALVPLAVKAGKFTEMDVPAMVGLCQLRVLQRELLRGAYASGLEQVGASGALVTHPHVAKLTSLQSKIDAGMDRFGLTPAGREAKAPEPAVDAFAEFDAAGTGVGGTVQ